MRAALLALAACGTPPPAPAPLSHSAPLLPALPKPAAIDTVSFTSMVVCQRCHVAAPGGESAAGLPAMRDIKGRDISPYTELQSSMMGLAARDPYFLAAVRRELAYRPGHETEAVCLACHAPVGYAEDPALTLDELERGDRPAAALGRDGTGCLGCHAMQDGVLRRDRVAFGSLAQPLADAMLAMSKTRPVPSAAISSSALCGSCHTVVIGGLLEQGTFLEWQASSFARAGDDHGTCQSCHQPSGDPETNDPSPISTPFSTRPPNAPSRDDYRHHQLRGGNAYLLGQLAAHAAWTNAAPAEELAAARTSTQHFLTTAADLQLAASHTGVHVTVENRTGHKLPTGFPTRRMWLHAVAVDAQGAIVFESGSHRRGAVLVGGRGIRIDQAGAILPHATRIERPEQVAIWEAVPVDDHGRPTHVMFAATRFATDDRIVPRGWRDAPGTVAPIGVDGDPDFVPGSDGVDYLLPGTAVRLDVELLYQSIPPETLESYASSDGLEAARFLAIADSPPLPVVLASRSLALDPSR